MTLIKSGFNQYYHMDAPFSAVIETYRACESAEYFNIVTFNPNQISHHMICDHETLSIMQNRSLHQHDFFEFMFVLEGEVISRIENTERTYPAGTGCLVNCNLRHAEKFSQDFRVFFLNLSRDYVRNMLSAVSHFYFEEEKNIFSHSLFAFLSENTDQISDVRKEYLDFFPVFLSKASYDTVYHLAETLFHTLLFPSFGSSYLVDSLICQILQALSSDEYFHVTDILLDYGTDFLLFTQISHLLDDSHGRLSRQELSELLNYSGDYLNRIVKKYTGLTIFEYGMTFCLRKAEDLLSTTSIPVSQIATMLHFSNRTHFYHVFKLKHGMTPKEFRRMQEMQPL